MRSIRSATLALSVAAMAVTAIAGAGTSASAKPRHDKAPVLPTLSVQAASSVIKLDRYGHRVYPNIGVYAVADNANWEVRANRTSYSDPISSHLVTTGGDVAMPGVTLKSFRSLPAFSHLVIKDKSGKTVVNENRPFCPGYGAARVRPDAPDVSSYPEDCPFNPFTVGGVYGINEGFGVPIISPYGHPLRLALGTYTATVSINAPYLDPLDEDGAQTSVNVTLKVVKGNRCVGEGRGCVIHPVPGKQGTPDSVYKSAGQSPKGAGKAVDPPMDVRPDLEALPASGIQLSSKGWLRFGATVWNAGPSPMVVDGFRVPGHNRLKSYQYFYDSDRNEWGYHRAGSMVWDPRPGHEHWHFEDFAKYELVDGDKQFVSRSKKEAFCLANTDAVDYTVEGANWKPFNTDLATSCGDLSSLSVREVLDVGSGDTYYQYKPGQSFDVRNLPNGKYFIKITANPDDVIYESNTDNNVSYRKILLRGKGDNRRVVVPDVGLIHAP